jgi:HAD superfamily hydrolase (TIGR01490 family)
MKKYAFFDVDNTVYNGYTASDIFFYASKKGEMNVKFKDEYLKIFELYRNGEIDYSYIAKKTLEIYSKSIKGMSKSQVKSLYLELFNQKKELIFNWVSPVIKLLKLNNFKIVLISGGPDIAIENLIDKVGAHEWYATNIEYLSNKFTGKNPNIMDNKNKVKIIKKITKNNKKSFSLGFGDSSGDIPMLKIVDKAFVVYNDHHPDMMQYSKRKKWFVFKSTDEVIKEVKKAVIRNL